MVLLYRRLLKIYRSHLQASRILLPIFPEGLVRNYTLRNIPEECIPRQRRGGSLQSRFSNSPPLKIIFNHFFFSVLLRQLMNISCVFEATACKLSLKREQNQTLSQFCGLPEVYSAVEIYDLSIVAIYSVNEVLPRPFQGPV